MHLEKIEIQGFKSFANRTVLEFAQPDKKERGVACIVGPNGSGKSNVVDAIRWVLGEQSLKSLRGKKSEDVIFSGSQTKGRLGMAQVQLFINKADHKMPVDYDQVIISRKLYRNGESEYLINKSKVRLQDIIMILAKANFGQKSYSIVSQGSIDQVIMASPHERKDYFDEAVGVRQFQIKRDQSINKLETAWNNLRSVDALLTEITPRLNSLTRQVKRLEKREAVEKELKEVAQKYYGFEFQEILNQIQQVKPQLETSQKTQQEKEKELRSLQAQLNDLEKQEGRSTVFNELQSKYQAVLEEKNKLREEQLMLQNKIELAKQRLSQKALPIATSEVVDRLKKISELEKQLFDNLQNSSPASLAQAKEDSRELRRLLLELIDAIENPKTTQETKAEIDPSLLEDLKAVEADISGVQQRLEEASKGIEQFNQSEEKKQGKFFDIQRQITKLQDEYNQLANKTSGFRVEMAKLETRQADLKNEIKEETGSLTWLDGHKAQTINAPQVREEMIKLKRQLELIGGVDPEIVEEYKQTKERHDFLADQADDLRNSIKSLEKIINELDDQIQTQFDIAFKSINKEFDHFFKILFGGGKASLVLLKDDPEEVKELENAAQGLSTENLEDDKGEKVEEGILGKLTKAEENLSPKKFLKRRTGKVITGIDILATPPGKKVSSINILSGGERSLASIALICAVIANNPSPFVILDEVDAALDEANSQRFAKIVKELEHKTQFIVITHNRASMYVADVLYGVTMGDDGISKLISLKLEEAERVVRQ